MAYTNVGFKYGTQENLNALITNKTAEEGCFYLTSDTQRLYIGQAVTGGVIPASVNAGIQFVNSIDELPNKNTTWTDDEKDRRAGEFYYIPTENILCVFTGSDYVQINATENTYITSNNINFTNGKKVPESGTTPINYTKIKSSVIDNNGSPYDAFFGVIGDDIVSVSVNTENIYDTDSNGNILYIQDDESISTDQTSRPVIKQQSILHIGEYKYTLSTSNDTYTIGTGEDAQNKDGVSIKLANGDYKNIIDIVSGDNVTIDKVNTANTTVTGTNNRTTSDIIQISAIDTTLASLSIDGKSSTADQDSSLNGNGFLVTATDSNGDSVTGTFDPVIRYTTVGGSTQDAHFNDSILTLPVVDQDYLNNLMRTLNAMVYRGTIGELTGAVATSINSVSGTREDNGETVNYTGLAVYKNSTKVSVSNGDVFLVNTNNGFSYDNNTYSTGTLFIAQGEEDSTGYIPDWNLTFTIVEDTKDSDTTYALGTDTTDKAIVLKDSDDSVAGVKVGIASGNQIDVSLNNNTFTINHVTNNHQTTHPSGNNDQNATTLDNTTGTIELVTGVTVDSYGHTTGVQTTYYNVANQKVQTKGIAIEENTRKQGDYKEGIFKLDTDVVDVNGTTLERPEDDYDSGNLLVASSTLDINTYTSGNTDGKTGLSIELKWGTFDSSSGN